MNAGLLVRVIEHELGSTILARNREISFDYHSSGRIMLAEILPTQEQEVA